MTCVYPATWEVKIKRTGVQGQYGQKVSKTPFQQISRIWWFIPVVSALKKA
jgi:hypothetical protein